VREAKQNKSFVCTCQKDISQEDVFDFKRALPVHYFYFVMFVVVHIIWELVMFCTLSKASSLFKINFKIKKH
jgi:hypothetical protein